ncbi:hypothetical protein J2128_002130 [Methanomicrobium sp. W14]|uniref:DUF5803 family protein n=1 Tax=Methanomicrobium sp. W14 TaxID=2817839 RepID=UPI001AE7E193|nr:DUF5803 family protein [Methanomicrobium sp. W14]MBP2134164.1 hypothetical protein [Methanomicrobium sp. W14]
MRPADRDRCRFRVTSFCAALIILSSLVFCVSGLNASYYVYENASSYHASVDIQNLDGFEFLQPGILGEKVPLEVSNVSLAYENGTNATFEDKGRSITFEKGNYTAGYDAELKNKDFQVLFDNFYNVTLYLPKGYDVRNPLLGTVSTGGSATENNGTVQIDWTRKSYAEARFYDAFQVEILTIFGTFWIALVAVFLVPYILSRRKSQ